MLLVEIFLSRSRELAIKAAILQRNKFSGGSYRSAWE
jgi:hypothetical protein